MPPTITILLASYNGQRFISEQLASVEAQTYPDWQLHARDDGSSDRTMQMLRLASDRDPRIHVIEPDGRRLGSTGNFGALLEWTLAHTQSEYFMFCDQDDVWREDKVRVTMLAMQRAEAEFGAKTPILVHTDFDFADERLRTFGSLAEVARRLSSPEDRILNKLLSQNFMYGCTMMFNRPLAEACVPLPAEAEQHDYWVALVAAAVGRIVHLPERTVRYRQHGSNETPGLDAASFRRRLRRLALGWGETARLNRQRYRQAEALASHLAGRLDEEKQRLITGYLEAMRRGGLPAARFAYRNGLRRQGGLQTARYLVSLLVSGSGREGNPVFTRSSGR